LGGQREGVNDETENLAVPQSLQINHGTEKGSLSQMVTTQIVKKKEAANKTKKKMK